jgi:hypothetical protein
MYQLLVQKFDQVPMRERLLQTGRVDLVADVAQAQRLEMGAELPARVVHHMDAVADRAAHRAQRRRLAPQVAVVPAVDLEAGEAAICRVLTPIAACAPSPRSTTSKVNGTTLTCVMRDMPSPPCCSFLFVADRIARRTAPSGEL